MLRLRTSSLVGFCTAAFIAAVGTPTAVRSQSFEYDNALRAVEEQVMVSQRIVSEALLAALEFEPESNLARLERSRVQFNSTFRAFLDREGDIGSRLANDLEVIREVEEAEALWLEMDETITRCIEAQAVTAEHVDSLAGLSDSIGTTVGGLADFLRQSAGHNAHGMLENAIQAAVHAEAMSQQMTKEFLLVAYGHQPERYRYALRGTSEDFETGLRGLLEGDFDQLLLPAPTPEIREQLERVDRIWQDEYRPLIDQAIGEEMLDDAAVARMSQANRRLLREMETAASLYRTL